jgi:ribonuclease BN (tRNA processing enzyme)
VSLARGVDLLLAEATYVEQVPEPSRPFLTSARQAGRQATDAAARHLVLTHLWPGTAQEAARATASDEYDGEIDVATPGLVVDLS